MDISCEGNRGSNGKVLPYKILDQAPLNTKLFRVNKKKLRSINITERPELIQTYKRNQH